MKKILLLFLMIFISMNTLKAECSYKVQKEYNILASQVQYKVDYSESSGSFNVTFYNLSSGIAIKYAGEDYIGNNGEVTISYLPEGLQLEVNVVTTDNECSTRDLRNIRVSLPYTNAYYGSEDCVGHEDLIVCSSRFLDYKITRSTFYGLLEKKEIDNTKTEEIKEEIKEESFLDKLKKMAEDIYIPVIIVLVSSGIKYGI